MDRQRFDDLVAQSRYQAVHLVDKDRLLAFKGDMDKVVLQDVKHHLVNELFRTDKIKMDKNELKNKRNEIEYRAEFFVFSRDELKLLLEMARRL